MSLSAAAPHGGRAAAAERLAALYGVSVATVYRHAGRGGSRRRREPARPEYREWVRIAVRLAHRSPKPMPLDVAIRGGIGMGLLPAEAAGMPLATAQRVRRELGLVATNRRTHRLSADHPMQAVLVDGSSSEHLVVERALPDGDHLLKLHRRPYSASGYKNKPLGPDRLRVLVYGVWDMCTGLTLSRYCVARGETAVDQMEFLCWAFGDDKDPRLVMRGLPDDLWSDQGAWCKSAAVRDLCGRLGIFIPPTVAYAKERMGGVERPHRTRWARFESGLFLRREPTLTLSELNARSAEFEIEENGRRNARIPLNGRFHSRSATWTALVNARPKSNPLRRMPPNAIETMAREARRRVDRNGIVKWGGAEYEVRDWHDRWVLARRPLDGGDGPDRIVVEDEATGERREAARWEPRPYGEVRGVPATELDRVLDGGGDVPGADVWAPGGGDGAVVPMPARTAPPGPLEDPLDPGDAFPSQDEAMAHFLSRIPYPISEANRRAAGEAIAAAGLSRRAVEELAAGLAGLGAAGNQ